MKNSLNMLAVIGFTSLMMVSCTKKEGCMDPNATNFDATAEKDCCCEYATTFDLKLNLESYVGPTALAEGGTYNVYGTDVQFDLVQMYISNVRFVDAAGNEVASDSYQLVKPEDNEYSVGSFEAGNYTKLRFDVGIDSVTNHADPSVYPLNDPLGPQFPPMHWSWDAGYIFIRIDAKADQDGDGTTETAFEMHIGRVANLRTVELDLPLDGAAGNSYTANININWLQFFNGVDFSGALTTHTGDNPTLTALLVENITDMFSIAE